jgi:hypothetical protein
MDEKRPSGPDTPINPFEDAIQGRKEPAVGTDVRHLPRERFPGKGIHRRHVYLVTTAGCQGVARHLRTRSLNRLGTKSGESARKKGRRSVLA